MQENWCGEETSMSGTRHQKLGGRGGGGNRDVEQYPISGDEPAREPVLYEEDASKGQ
uniref:Uncharacterized protein n=1 Tax=Anguilla anguilla TaxID=7936 RepID=A0A0E9PTC6_ANGAN